MSREKMESCSKGWWERRYRGGREESMWGRVVQGSRGTAPISSGPGWLVERKGHYSFSFSRWAYSKTPSPGASLATAWR